MTKTTRARYTLKFKQEAVSLVEGRKSIAAAAAHAGRGGVDADQLGQGQEAWQAQGR